MMKIDEDLIYGQTEQIRDQLIHYIQICELDDKTNLFIRDISKKLKDLVKVVKREQEERDSYQIKEINELNQERIKYFDY